MRAVLFFLRKKFLITLHLFAGMSFLSSESTFLSVGAVGINFTAPKDRMGIWKSIPSFFLMKLWKNFFSSSVSYMISDGA
jgi:hypothetical protein